MKNYKRLKANKTTIYSVVILLTSMFLLSCDKNMNTINFDNIPQSLPQSPNYAVATTESLSAFSSQSEIINTHIFPYPAKELAKQIKEIILIQPRTTLIYEDVQQYEFQFKQTTKWLKFPDWIDLKVIEIDPDTSSFIMISRSQYGHYDFGENKRRLKQWVKLIEDKLLK